jgi:hypothetical protein
MFTEPETREIEQAILQSQSDAEKIAALAKNGKSLKDAVKEITANESDFIASQPFKKEPMERSGRKAQRLAAEPEEAQ